MKVTRDSNKYTNPARQAFGRSHFNTVVRRNADLGWYTRRNLWRPSFTSIARGNADLGMLLSDQKVDSAPIIRYLPSWRIIHD
ncbi:hypothetical protein QJS04_geneDACA013323 [Acorus gramineus]|uniref:Uncharacterized protein n=1 Tax=Acorus gramineus TaxID=55184 RepID=A0AAV9A937_ACOGR|nr:hypothetical protein QJS04_geneDACA013323 [Acorus gramineus]